MRRVRPLRDEDDSALLRAHRAGDVEAFGELVRRYQDRLWAVALRTLADPQEAADALQDALLAAFRAAGSFRGDSAVTTWLHRIVVNACLDRIRRRSSRPTVPLDSVQDPPSASVDLEVALDVRAALRQLPADQRVALTLVDVEGFRVADAAIILGVAEGTIKSRCSRGRARLAQLLGYLVAPEGNPPASDGVPSTRAEPGGGG